ncbi:MAG: zinc ribbon domain-containing protein [Kiritimatiellae bacterium]|nr:zinc ribbon domain-containing protein [Kiritimatiellia bacterium]
MSDTPDTPETDATRPDLHVIHDAPDLHGAGKPCPKCGAKAPADAVLCVQCGYNFKTGKNVSGGLPPETKRLIALGAVAGVILVGGLVWFLLPKEEEFVPPANIPSEEQIAADRAAREQKLAEEKAAKEKAEADKKAAEEAKIAAEKEAALQAQAEAEAAAARAAEEAAAAAAAEAEAQRQAFEAKKAQALETFRARLDATEPMIQPGETVELRTRNGLVQKGVFKRYGRRDGVRFAVLETELNGTLEIPIQDMDPATRRRCDAEFRAAYIQRFIDAKASQIQAAQAADAAPAAK